MRRQAATAALMALAWTLFSSSPSPAKPTRTLARPTARRLIVGQPIGHPALHSSRKRTPHPSASSRATSHSAPIPSLYDSRGRLPHPLYGTRDILLRQNEMADRDGLNRVRDDAELLELRRQKKLVALPENETLQVDYHLPENRRFSRPWTAAFLSVLSRDYYATFRTPLQVDSAVRTIAIQQRLLRTNGNAAPVSGEMASPHLTGQAVDIAKAGLSLLQIAWMRTYLQPLIEQGKIDVEEEFQQACFHISVYKAFLPAASRIAIAAAHQLPAEPLPGGPNQ